MERSLKEGGEMAVVNTVTGPKDTSDLGATLMHEHVFVLTPEINRDYPDISWGGSKDARIEQAITKLQKAKASGIDTIVDLTCMGMDRYIPNVQRVLANVNINVIVATGIYTYDHLPHFLEMRKPSNGSRDVMTDMFVKDITDGIADSGAKAAILKCCTDKPGVTPNIERILRAVARAHRDTGAPISTHSDANLQNGRDQQRIFAEEGVDLSRVVIGHSGDTKDLSYLHELMDRGSIIGCDRFGLYHANSLGFDDRVDVVAQLCEQGYADRIVLSHDCSCYMDWLTSATVNAQPKWELTHVPDDVVPALKERGVTDAQVQQMLVGNPKRLFDKQGAY
jgi:phosphotriesterase-related protein